MLKEVKLESLITLDLTDDIASTKVYINKEPVDFAILEVSGFVVPSMFDEDKFQIEKQHNHFLFPFSPPLKWVQFTTQLNEDLSYYNILPGTLTIRKQRTLLVIKVEENENGTIFITRNGVKEELTAKVASFSVSVNKFLNLCRIFMTTHEGDLIEL